MGTWSSGIGKFVKKDPDHGKWWKAIKKWLNKIGLLKDHKRDIPNNCCNKDCGCHKK